MKLISLAAVLVFAFPALAAAQHDSSVCAGPPNPSGSLDPVVLSVCYYGTGMTALPRLRLHFRVRKSGVVEYEVNAPRNRQDANSYFRLQLKKARVTTANVAELIALGEQPDFQAAKDEYPVFRIWIDSGLKTTVVFISKGREKKILLNNYHVSDAQNQEHYPASLIRLLERVEELRPKDR
jgi:hypothetical protein